MYHNEFMLIFGQIINNIENNLLNPNLIEAVFQEQSTEKLHRFECLLANVFA